MDPITWPVAALTLATVALILSNIGNEIRRRRKLKKYREKVVAELRSSGPSRSSSPGKSAGSPACPTSLASQSAALR
jgi:hypothetical protein